MGSFKKRQKRRRNRKKLKRQKKQHDSLLPNLRRNKVEDKNKRHQLPMQKVRLPGPRPFGNAIGDVGFQDQDRMA